MPNHVANIIRMERIMDEPLFSLTRENEIQFDFNKIIPMPESLNIESSTKQDVALELCLRKLGTKGMFLEADIQNKSNMNYDLLYKLGAKTYAQMPEDQFQKKRSYYEDISDEELAKFGLQVITNKVLYGAKDWYDWCCDNWGTKWNSYRNDKIDRDTIEFQTAWGAPHEIIIKLAEMYPRAIIQHWWAEEFIGSGNSGYQLYKNGQIFGGYDEPMSYDAFQHCEFCWRWDENYYEHMGNAIYLLGTGNAIYEKYSYLGNTIYYIQEYPTYEEYLQD